MTEPNADSDDAEVATVADVLAELRKLRPIVERLSRRVRLGRVVLTVTLVAVLLGGVGVYQNHRVGECVQAWADRSADRTKALARPLDLRNSTLDDFLATLATSDKSAQQIAFRAAVTAADNYEAAVKANPPVPGPSLHCPLL